MHSPKSAFKYIQHLALYLLCFFIAGAGLLTKTAHAEESEKDDSKVIRAGWFDSSFCYWDQFGRRCGIDYEYQHKISAYTGWTYEYVEDSWPNLFQMLKDGKIDLLCDVSYKPERAEYMLFPDLPMGAESYYIYVDSGRRDLVAGDFSSFNGTRIGVNEGSIQEGFLKDWSGKNHVDIEIIPLTEDEDESLEKVIRGELDGYASIYSFSSEQKVTPVCRIGQSEYFYAVNKNRPDILADLNRALASIQDEDPYFNQRLTEERLYNTRTNASLTPNQEDWITSHGPIRIGYLDNVLPFCQSDSNTGELTGALKDYLAHAANNLRNTDIHFEAIPFGSIKETIDALKAGEIDCAFPVYLNSYDSDQMEIRLTNPLMTTEMNALMRASKTQDLSRDSTISFAVLDGELNVETFIMDQYPQSSRKTFPTIQACFDAVASGAADCYLISNYRIPSAEDTIKKYNFFSVPTGETLPFSFAVRSADKELYFLLNKTVLMTRDEDMASALASYMRVDQKVSLEQFLKDNWVGMIVGILAIAGVIIGLLIQKLKAERLAYEQQIKVDEGLRRELEQKEQIRSAMDMAYRDSLTGVKSKHAYKEAEEQMDQRIRDGSVSEFSVIVFDLNDLKTINDTLGHEVGDEYIKDACKLICTCFKHSPVFRIGGDEFTAILEGEDYSNQEELLEKFEKQVLVNLERDRTVVAFGCSRFDPQQDKSFRAVFERADATMYKEKVLLKSLGTESKGTEAETSKEKPVFEDISAIKVRRHLLIADDVDSNREILGDLLTDDYDIIYASDGLEVMNILRSRKDDIAVVLLDLYMPNMSGREVMTQMQVDEDLMYIPVIFISVDQNAELDCLRLGAMDFIPKPYPDIEIIKARIGRCVELSENRDLIRRTQRDKLTGLFNIDYFLRYVYRYDQHYKDTSFDAVVFNVNRFHEMNEKYGRQFGDLVLRSIGISTMNLARKTGGIGCRKEGDTFLLYCPHRDDYEQLFRKFLEDLFVEADTADKVTLRFGVFAHARQEPDLEERFIKAKHAADSTVNDPQKLFGYYEMIEQPD